MTTYRSTHDRDNHYVQLSKEVFTQGLSMAEVGLLCYLLAQSDEWEPNPKQLADTFNCGTTTIRSAIAKLKQKRFLVCRQIRGRNGVVLDWRWDIHETPTDISEGARTDKHGNVIQLSGRKHARKTKAKTISPSAEKPHAENLNLDNLQVENREQINNICNNNISSKNIFTLPPTPLTGEEREELPEGSQEEDVAVTVTVTPLETAETSTNSDLTQQSLVRVNVSPRDANDSQPQIKKYDPALGMVAEEDRRTRQQQQFDWVPDGEWKTPDGRLDPGFVDWLAKQWVRNFGGDIHAKRRDVLLHFKKDAANVAIAWDSYHREALHRVAVVATSVASGMSESHLAKEVAHVQPYLKAAATPTQYSPVAYTMPAAVQEFTPQLGAAIEQRISGVSAPEIIGSLPASSPDNPAPDLGEINESVINESVEAYKPFVAPSVDSEEQRENLKRLSQMTKEVKRFGGSPKPPEANEARIAMLNRWLQDPNPTFRNEAIKKILASDDYELVYDEEGSPVSVNYVPF